MESKRHILLLAKRIVNPHTLSVQRNIRTQSEESEKGIYVNSFSDQYLLKLFVTIFVSVFLSSSFFLPKIWTHGGNHYCSLDECQDAESNVSIELHMKTNRISYISPPGKLAWLSASKRAHLKTQNKQLRGESYLALLKVGV